MTVRSRTVRAEGEGAGEKAATVDFAQRGVVLPDRHRKAVALRPRIPLKAPISVSTTSETR